MGGRFSSNAGINRTILGERLVASAITRGEVWPVSIKERRFARRIRWPEPNVREFRSTRSASVLSPAMLTFSRTPPNLSSVSRYPQDQI
jgi:hypothetical protein